MFGRSCLLNELELFPEKQSVDTSSAMTTKELAETLKEYDKNDNLKAISK